MDNLRIRAAIEADIPGICHVNRGEEGPWAEPESCAGYVQNRLKNGFYIQVAEWEGRIVGHGEWIVSDERRWKTFYLGQLQVDPEFQRRGVGREMLVDGVAQAKRRGCESISLIPETDTGSQHFYEKCGLKRGKDILRCALPAQNGPFKGEVIAEAPREIVKESPFLFGLTQTAAEHMWQVFNRRPAGEGRRVETLAGDGFILQLGAFRKSDNALLLAWGEPENAREIVRTARAFAFALDYPGVEFNFFSDHPALPACFAGQDVIPENYEMYLEF